VSFFLSLIKIVYIFIAKLMIVRQWIAVPSHFCTLPLLALADPRWS
jgi:hypothetical protein